MKRVALLPLGIALMTGSLYLFGKTDDKSPNALNIIAAVVMALGIVIVLNSFGGRR